MNLRNYISEVSYDPKLSKEDLTKMKAKTRENVSKLQGDKKAMLERTTAFHNEMNSFLQKENERVKGEGSDRWTSFQKIGKIVNKINDLKVLINKI